MTLKILTAAMLASALILAGVAVVVWIRKRKTRESFSVVAVGAVVSLVAAVSPALLGEEKVGQTALILLARLFNIAYEPSRPSTADKVLAIALVVIAILVIDRIHKRWHGPISAQHFAREQANVPWGLLAEALAEVRRLAQRRPQELHDQRRHFQEFADALRPPERIPWDLQARDLVRLRRPRIRWQEDSWDRDSASLLGEDQANGRRVVLSVPPVFPGEPHLRRLVERAMHSLPAGSQVDVICAVENGPAPSIRHVNGLKIQIESENSLLANVVDFGEYFEDIRRRVESDSLPESTLAIKDIYVEPLIRRTAERSRSDDRTSHPLMAYLLDWLEDSKPRQLGLLGDYGQGKSTAALMFTHHLITKGLQHGRIPILIELRGKSPRNMSPTELLGAWAARYSGIDPQALAKMTIAGKTVLIFEGFDEMALIGTSELRVSHFRTLWKFCYPKAKILITGRPNFFLDDDEKMRALGIGQQQLGRPYSETLDLLPFEVHQIRTALRSVGDTQASEICSMAERNGGFLELVSRPSLLYIVGQLWKTPGFAAHANLNSAFVINLFVENSYRRQGLKAEGDRTFMALNTPERSFFMRGVSAFMVARALPNQITDDQLDFVVKALIDEIPPSVSRHATAMTGETTDPLRERLAEDDDAIEHVKTDVRTCALLVEDKARGSGFCFAHKSFMEYLAASIGVGGLLQKDEGMGISAVERATGISSRVCLEQPQVVKFMAELLVNHIYKNGNDRSGNSDKLTAERLARIVFGQHIVVARMVLRLRSIQSKGLFATLLMVAVVVIAASGLGAWRLSIGIATFVCGLLLGAGWKTYWNRSRSGRFVLWLMACDAARLDRHVVDKVFRVNDIFQMWLGPLLSRIVAETDRGSSPTPAIEGDAAPFEQRSSGSEDAEFETGQPRSTQAHVGVSGSLVGGADYNVIPNLMTDARAASVIRGPAEAASMPYGTTRIGTDGWLRALKVCAYDETKGKR